MHESGGLLTVPRWPVYLWMDSYLLFPLVPTASISQLQVADRTQVTIRPVYGIGPIVVRWLVLVTTTAWFQLPSARTGNTSQREAGINMREFGEPTWMRFPP